MKKIISFEDDQISKKNIWQRSLSDFQKDIKKGSLFCIQQVLPQIKNYDKYNFYPLIGELLNEIGLNTAITRDGDTNNRADAIIIDRIYSIPIEIKSPTEIPYINIKSIRQALENKIILLSRKFYNTDIMTSTLAIGFNYPEERSEVPDLIDNFYNTYNINVGYIDISDILKLHFDYIINNKKFDIDRIRKLKGEFK
jgi:hypothetical protein